MANKNNLYSLKNHNSNKNQTYKTFKDILDEETDCLDFILMYSQLNEKQKCSVRDYLKFLWELNEK